MSAARVLADTRPARAATEVETRAVLLSAAASILSEEGTAALTVRRLADAVHASTKMRGCWRPCTGTSSTASTDYALECTHRQSHRRFGPRLDRGGQSPRLRQDAGRIIVGQDDLVALACRVGGGRHARPHPAQADQREQP